MTAVNKIDSRATGLRIAEEASLGVLGGTPDWLPYEPNSYSDFGAEVQTVARAPIAPDRQRKKSTKVGINVGWGFNTDVTQTNLQEVMQGFFFADHRPKTEFGGGGEVTGVDGTTEDYDAASGLDAYEVGDLVFASGFTNAANNGLKRVTAAAAAALTVAEDLVDEVSPPNAAKLVMVGFQFAAGDLDVTAGAGGDLPKYTTTTKDLTELGLLPGEWIYVGGDTSTLDFSNAANNGWKRIRSISTNQMEVDKSDLALVTEASTTETVQVFFGRVLKNETGSDITRRTYQAERQLGAPDDAQPAQIQAQYEVGSVAGEAVLNIPLKDILKADLSFLAINEERIDGATALKTGNRPSVVEADAYNTSTDVKRFSLTRVVAGDEDPTPLFVYIQELTLNINNQLSPNDAVGVDASFDISDGDFEVGGQLTAYFADVDAVDAVNDNADISLDLILVRSNAGWAIDMPLVSLNDGRLNVEKGAAVTLPLGQEAASGSKVDSTLNHTLMMSWFDYLPDAAEA
jgi:hypothetical protein